MSRIVGAEEGRSSAGLGMETGAAVRIGLGGDNRAGLVTARDVELVRWIGRIGAVTSDQLIARFGLSRSTAYRRIAACAGDGLLERAAVIHQSPAFLTATRAGLRFAGLGLPVVRVSTALARHHHVCADVAIWLEECYGPHSVLSVRELIFEEQLGGRAIASGKVGELLSGGPRLHRPDFAVIDAETNRAIEVELTPKAPARLDRIVRAWSWADGLEEVLYVCAPGAVRRAVEESVRRTGSEEEVRVIGLEEIKR